MCARWTECAASSVSLPECESRTFLVFFWRTNSWSHARRQRSGCEALITGGRTRREHVICALKTEERFSFFFQDTSVEVQLKIPRQNKTPAAKNRPKNLTWKWLETKTEERTKPPLFFFFFTTRSQNISKTNKQTKTTPRFHFHRMIDFSKIEWSESRKQQRGEEGELFIFFFCLWSL